MKDICWLEIAIGEDSRSALRFNVYYDDNKCTDDVFFDEIDYYIKTSFNFYQSVDMYEEVEDSEEVFYHEWSDTDVQDLLHIIDVLIHTYMMPPFEGSKKLPIQFTGSSTCCF